MAFVEYTGSRSDIPVQTLTIREAMMRHKGLTQAYFMRRCEEGGRLLQLYKHRKKIPREQARTALFGQKVGKYWIISIKELDRYFCVV